VERLVNELSVTRKQTVVIESSSSFYVPSSHEWLSEPVGAGNFTVEANKEPVGEALHLLVQRAKNMALDNNNVSRYRQLRSMKSSLLSGLPVGEAVEQEMRSESIDEWMDSMGFKSAEDGKESGWTPLRYAIYTGRLDIARELLRHGTDVEAPLAEVDGTFGYHMQGCTILHGLAYACDSPEAINLLIEYRADVLARQAQGLTAIMMAAHGQRIKNFKALAEIAPDLIGTRCDFACAPIHYAVCTGNHELFTLAHQYHQRTIGFDPAIYTGQGASVILCGIIHAFCPDVLQKAVDFGYDVNFAGTLEEHMDESSKQLIGALSQAAEASDRPTQLQLVWGSLDGFSPLMCAAVLGKVLAVRTLLDAGASVDARNNQGRTALCFACMAGHTEIVQMLLEAGATTDFVDSRGRTAAKWAQAHKVSSIEKLFEQEASSKKELLLLKMSL